MARLTDIKSEIKTMLAAITTTNGYTVTWGSTDEPDMALVTSYPASVVEYESEDVDSDERNAQYGWSNAEFIIKVRCQHTGNPWSHPELNIDQYLDNVLSDMKKKFSTSGGVLALSYHAVIKYKGFTREKDRAGDVWIPGSIITRWNVFYQFKTL